MKLSADFVNIYIHFDISEIDMQMESGENQLNHNENGQTVENVSNDSEGEQEAEEQVDFL